MAEDQQDAQQDGADEAPVQEAQPAAQNDLGDAGKRALDAERKRAQDFERELKVLRREREQERTKGLSEAERAVAEAETRGRTVAATEFGQRLARTEFVAEAARRNPTFNARDVLDDLNLSRYVSEDGEPDSKAIAKAVERLIPAPVAAPSFDGGARTSAGAPADMNSLLRSLAGR